MERNFSTVMTELRREKGLSQKDAAQKLGVSQALLSHYEKGIRECGQDFLVRAADFYGVTCDYLLGRSTSKTGFNDILDTKITFPDDGLLSSQTIFRAGAFVRDTIAPEATADFNMFLAMSLYLAIINAVKEGNLPPRWASEDLSKFTPALENYMFSLVAPGLNFKQKKDKRGSAQEMPDCIHTVMESVTQFMKEKTKEIFPYV